MRQKKTKVKMPLDAVVAVTYRCNSRCVMCNIWEIKDFPELPAKEYLKLPNSLRDVNISGGEPFLRDDLLEIIKNVKIACPKAKINISTNGFLTSKIKEVLPEIKKIHKNISISISIDGIGAMHEKVRRVPHAWEKVLETINFCRSVLHIKDVKMAFTLNNLNYKQLAKAFLWSRRLGIDFSMAIAHSSELYFGEKHGNLILDKDLVKEQFASIIKKLLKSMKPKDWARAYFVDGLYRVSAGGPRPLESYAGIDFFYLDPRGDIYPSVIDNAVMGNITKDKFKHIWFSDEANKARDDIAGFESNYWMVCTARTAIKRNPLKVMNWVFKNKITNYK